MYLQSLLSGAHLLQVAGVVTACCRFLEHQLDPSNCLGILQLADTLAQEDLKTAAEGYVNRWAIFLCDQNEDVPMYLPIPPVLHTFRIYAW